MIKISKIIQDRLQSHADEKKARWLENYVKHDIRSRGVGIPVIREIVQAVSEEHTLENQPQAVQAGFLDDLMRQAFTEDKLAAILFMQLYGRGRSAFVRPAWGGCCASFPGMTRPLCAASWRTTGNGRRSRW